MRPGDRVIVPFQVSCGACDFCRRGLTASCATAGAGAAYGMAPIARREWGGALSDCVRVPYADAMLVALPAGLDPASVASVSDNVPDGWRAVAPYLERRPGAPVLVVGGAGDVALYAVAVAVALASEQVDYVDTDARRLAVAERLGARAVEQPMDGSRLGRYPITVDHSGDVAGLHSALRSTEPEGTCTSTAIYFSAETALPLLDMYTRGVEFRTGTRQRARCDTACARPGRVGTAASRDGHERDGAVGRRARRPRGPRREDGDRPLRGARNDATPNSRFRDRFNCDERVCDSDKSPYRCKCTERAGTVSALSPRHSPSSRVRRRSRPTRARCTAASNSGGRVTGIGATCFRATAHRCGRSSPQCRELRARCPPPDGRAGGPWAAPRAHRPRARLPRTTQRPLRNTHPRKEPRSTRSLRPTVHAWF